MKFERGVRPPLVRSARALPDPVKRVGKALLGGYARMQAVSDRNRCVFECRGREIAYRYLDAPSLLYLANCLDGDQVSHEGVPVELFDLPERYDVAVDVGAHFGVYSVLLGVFNDVDLYCFEPDPDNRRVLAANLAENGVDATVDGRVVSDETGSTTFYHHPGFDSVSHSTAPPPGMGDQFERTEVESVALSSVLADYDDANVFVKIDAEGEEARIVPDLLAADGVGELSGYLELHPDRLADDGESIFADLEREGHVYEQVNWSSQPDYCFTDAPERGRAAPFESLPLDERPAPALAGHSTR